MASEENLLVKPWSAALMHVTQTVLKIPWALIIQTAKLNRRGPGF